MSQLVTPVTRRHYGWNRSRPDFRDLRLEPPTSLLDASLPAKIDLSNRCVAPMDQGDLGSCVAHGVTAVVRFDRLKQGLHDVPLSRLQLYYDTRRVEGNIASDSGCEIRDAIKCAAKTGIGPEKDWPYNITRFASRPPPMCYRDALANQALEYLKVDNTSVGAIKSALVSGYPVVIGISCYESFESAAVEQTGIIPLPKRTEKQLGGHCLYLHGYGNQDPDYADGRNSWGTSWGNRGDFHIPFAYLTNPGMADDFWIIRKVG